MSTTNSVQHSSRMASIGPVSDGLVVKYVRRWMQDAFLERK